MRDFLTVPVADLDATKTLYLHIGHYKTGSSALQDYCSRHADDLRQQGYLYPATARPKRNPTNHGHLSLSVARQHGFVPPPWYGEDVAADDAYAALAAEIEAAPETKIVISSEEFVQLALRKDPAAAVGDLAKRLSAWDTRIVFYLREPLSLLKSWYNEVNKGPVGTRNFPTFFNGLNQHFLSQKAIWTCFADAFGQDNMITLSYGDVGLTHIEGFLKAIDCPHEPSEKQPLMNAAQPIETLEKRRLAKAAVDFGAASFSHIKDIGAFHEKAARISRDFDEVAGKAGLAVRSKLTSAAVIAHYARLLAPLLPDGRVNQKEVDNLRDMAFAVEQRDPLLARELMETAHMLRPDGKRIKARLEEYRAKLGVNP